MKRTKAAVSEEPAKRRAVLPPNRVDELIDQFNANVKAKFESVATDLTTPKKKNTMTIMDQINSCLYGGLLLFPVHLWFSVEACLGI
jgi:hypothetical protein